MPIGDVQGQGSQSGTFGTATDGTTTGSTSETPTNTGISVGTGQNYTTDSTSSSTATSISLSLVAGLVVLPTPTPNTAPVLPNGITAGTPPPLSNDPDASQQGSTSTLQTDYDTALGTALANAASTNGLSDEQVAQLTFAAYHPDLASPSTLKELKSLGIMTTVQNTMATQYGITLPQGFKPDPTQYDSQVTAAYDGTYTTLINNLLGADGTISDPNLAAYIASNTTGDTPGEAYQFQQETMQQLITILYHPEYPAPPALTAIAANYEQQAQATTQTQFGIPSSIIDYPPQNSETYDAQINVEYQAQLASGVSPSVALASVQAQYGLPSTWAPTSASSNWPTDPVSQTNLNMLQSVQQMRTEVTTALNNLPPGPASVAYGNFIKLVGDALAQLEQVISQDEVVNEQGSSSQSQAQLQAAQFQIQQRTNEMKQEQQQQAEVAKSAGKASEMSNVMKYLGPIMTAVAVIATIASLGTMGPFMMCVMIAMTSLSVADTISQAAGGPNITQEATYWTGYVLSCGQANPQTCELIGAAFMVAVALVGGGVEAGVGGLDGAALAGASTAVKVGSVAMDVATVSAQTGFVQEACTAANVSPQEAMYISLAVNGALMVMSLGSMSKGIDTEARESSLLAKAAAYDAKAAAAVSTIRAAGYTGKLTFAAAREYDCVSEYMTYMFNDFMSNVMRGMVDILKGESSLPAQINSVGGAASSGVQGAGSYFQAQSDGALAVLDKLVGKFNAADDTVQAEVDALKAMVKQIMKIMNQMVDMKSGVDVQETQIFSVQDHILQNMAG